MNDETNVDYIEVHQSKDNEYYFVCKAANHEVVLTSETYTRASSAVDAAKKAFADVTVYLKF